MIQIYSIILFSKLIYEYYLKKLSTHLIFVILDYTTINRISEGTFGIVYKAEFNKTHKIFALKELKVKAQDQTGEKTKLIKKDILMEFYACQNLHHRNIVNGFRYTFDGKIRIFMEYCQQKIKQLYQKNLKQKDRKSIYKQLLQALQYLSQNHFIHCDIKPDNIMVFQQASNDYSYILIPKLCDYGLGIIDQKVRHGIKLSEKYAFTDGYRPPEVVCGVGISCKSDVFSLGVTFLELLIGHNVFISNQPKSQIQIFQSLYGQNVVNYIKHGDSSTQYQVSFDFIWNEIQNLREFREYETELLKEARFLQKLLEPNMNLRRSASELLQDEFLSDSTDRDDEMLGQNEIYRENIQNLQNNFFSYYQNNQSDKTSKNQLISQQINQINQNDADQQYFINRQEVLKDFKFL